MIEKIIHQIWYQGESEYPEKFQKGIESWKTNHIDWQYMFWDEKKMKSVIRKDYPQYYKKWSDFHYMHQRIDFFKYILMDKYGGMYADIDTISLKSVNPLLKYDINGETIIVSKMTETFVSDIVGSINNGIIISSQGHPFWKWYMAKIMKQCNKTWWTKFSEIENTTGPSFFSKCILEYKGEGITVLNSNAFEPCYGGDPYCIPGSDSYANHKHEQTWVHPGLQWISKTFYYMKQHWALFLAILIIVTIIFVKIFF